MKEAVFVLEGATKPDQPLEVIDADFDLPTILRTGEAWLEAQAKPLAFINVTRITDTSKDLIFDSRVVNTSTDESISYVYHAAPNRMTL